MRLAISNIAWDISEDETIASILNRYAIDAIDIAPSKYFPQPAAATQTDIARTKQYWADRGIEITGMQSLLFGTTGLNVFGSSDSRQAMLEHLRSVCRIGGELGATRLVFGSPKNRDRGTLSDTQVQDIALPFFHKLGEIAASHGVIVCLEPNPSCYGANFMTDSAETVDVVRQVGHPAIRMQFDTGSITINAEDAEALLREHAPLIGHVHASEPNLVPLGEAYAGADHNRLAASLALHLPGHVVSIEMVATADEPHASAIERTIQAANRYYRADNVQPYS